MSLLMMFLCAIGQPSEGGSGSFTPGFRIGPSFIVSFPLMQDEKDFADMNTAAGLEFELSSVAWGGSIELLGDISEKFRFRAAVGVSRLHGAYEDEYAPMNYILVGILTGGLGFFFGETEDVAIGNAIDTFARRVGLPHPGGPVVEKLAKKGNYVELPYVVKGMDLSFSGIATAAEKLVKNGEKIEDVCFSLQETCFAMLVEVTERAVAHTGKKEVLLTGGVAANRRLTEMLEIMCREREAVFKAVPIEYAGDCGAMISWAGLLAYKSGVRTKDFDPISRWRTDDVDIKWVTEE